MYTKNDVLTRYLVIKQLNDQTNSASCALYLNRNLLFNCGFAVESWPLHIQQKYKPSIISKYKIKYFRIANI